MQSNVTEIKSDIQAELGCDEMAVISNAMQGCDDLFTLEDDCQRKSTMLNTSMRGLVEGGDIPIGKESVNRMQYAIRRLMKVVCSNLKNGVVMFIGKMIQVHFVGP